MITPIPSYYVSLVWPKAANHIKIAIERTDSGFSESDILTRLMVSDMQLWIVNDYQAAAVTQITVLPQFKTCTVVALGGDGLPEWFDELMQTIEDWARQMDCRYVTAYGRRGWEKVGKAREYRHEYSVMRKVL